MRASWTFSAVFMALPALGCAYPEYSIDEDLALPTLVSAPPDCGPHNATMAPVPGGYCIDLTEVTFEDYEDLTPTSLPALQDLPIECASAVLARPTDIACAVPDEAGRPVVCVTWCQAQLYCHARGKRLCGRFGGDRSAFDAYADAEASEWFNVCSVGGRRTYPYGDTYQSGACYTEPVPESGSPQLMLSRPVAGGTSCQAHGSEYEGVLDLSGNVAEWVDECRSGSGCRIRGGAAFLWRDEDSAELMRCAAADYLDPNSARLDYVGFRCCHTPPVP